jgi:hypothetical protein
VYVLESVLSVITTWVASLAGSERVEELPTAMIVGFAVVDTVGGFIVTVKVAVAVAPLAFAAVSV